MPLSALTLIPKSVIGYRFQAWKKKQGAQGPLASMRRAGSPMSSRLKRSYLAELARPALQEFTLREDLET